ncbi:MAG: hypothetical protein PUC82_00475, partial [bacterium]|nr:hypothetical protein [bacterium]
VIVIMGILMMVAIPSVSRVIENSRKDTFVDIAKSYANAARTLWTADGLTCSSSAGNVVSSAVDAGDYYILINTKDNARKNLPVLVDQGGKSSWGNRDISGYVRVNISNDNSGTEPKRVTKFYVAISDGTHGIYDDTTTPVVSDALARGHVKMTLTNDQKNDIEISDDTSGALKAGLTLNTCVES